MADQIGASSGNATPAQLLTGYTASNNTGPFSGSMPDNGALGTITPSPSTQSIPPGYTTGGSVAAVTFDASKVLTGTNIAGTAGTMPNQGQKILDPSGTGTVPIPQGYHDGTGYVAQVSVNASHLLTGDTVAGVTGTMPEQGSPTVTLNGSQQTLPSGHYGGITVPAGVPFAQGTATAASSQTANIPGRIQGTNYSSLPGLYAITISGLAFTPTIIVLKVGSSWSDDETVTINTKSLDSGDGSYNTAIAHDTSNTGGPNLLFNSMISGGTVTTYGQHGQQPYSWWAFGTP